MARSDSEVFIVEEDVSEPGEVDREAASESNDVADQFGSKVPVRIKYEAFYELPPKRSNEFVARCKLCHKSYRFTMNSKGNLLKHLQTSHPKNLDDHKNEQSKQLPVSQQTLHRDGTLVKATRPKPESFKKQDKILTCIVKNVCGRGGLPISVVEQSWFRTFMEEVEPRFQPVSRRGVSSKLDKLYEEEKRNLMADSATSVVEKPSVTVDFWTGCDVRSFMGCTVHYISQNELKSHMLFFLKFHLRIPQKI